MTNPDAREPALSLQGRLLIAPPSLEEGPFRRAVVHVCLHSDDGALGIVVNRPSRDATFASLAEGMGIALAAQPDVGVFVGGPVDSSRGLALHSDDYVGDSTRAINQGLALTGSRAILEDIAAQRGPRDALVALGYSGWGPQQLERELRRNVWLVGESAPDLLFHAPPERRYEAALERLGVNPAALVMTEGAGFA